MAAAMAAALLQLDELETQYDELQKKYDELQHKHDKLQKKYDELQKKDTQHSPTPLRDSWAPRSAGSSLHGYYGNGDHGGATRSTRAEAGSDAD